MKVTIRKAANGYILLQEDEMVFFNKTKEYVAESLKDISKMAEKAFIEFESKGANQKEKSNGKR